MKHAPIYVLAFAILVAALILAHRPEAQTSVLQPGYAVVVATCGAGVTWTAGQVAPITVNTAGSTCVNQ